MTGTARTSSAAPPKVAVIGGGIAGLTSALRLAQRGCEVTIFEEKHILGGNLSSDKDPESNIDHDVYPHMYADWYNNFWQIFEEELGLRREDHFEQQWSCTFMRKPTDGKTPIYIDMPYGPTLKEVMANYSGGLLSPPDTFLLGFSFLDLAAQPPTGATATVLDRLDVNGYFYSRGYSVDEVGKQHDRLISLIWSIPSNMTSASAYQNFIKHHLAFPHINSFGWLLKGSVQAKIIGPLEAKLKALGCVIETDAGVTAVTLKGERPIVEVGPTSRDDFDYVILAVPGTRLADLVMSGEEGHRLVDRVQTLSELKRVWGEQLPVIDVYFKKKLPGIPRGVIGLLDSGYDLSIMDTSRLWADDPNMKDITALSLAASNDYAIPAPTGSPTEKGFLMIQRLNEFLPSFRPGKAWGDPASDIDWTKTRFRQNDKHLLLANDVGSDDWRPTASYPKELPNVFFAGYVCLTDVDIATIEAAVQSGTNAARALQVCEEGRRGGSRMGADEIRPAPHEIHSNATLLAAKLALLPAAYAASVASRVLSAADKLRTRGYRSEAYSPIAYTPLLALDYANDWWRTAYWLARALTHPEEDSHEGHGGHGVAGVDHGDRATVIGGPVTAVARLAGGVLKAAFSAGASRLMNGAKPH
ncbi:MAG: FAD-dependent oxidoreductase [Caulobacteraceae bacterium]